MRQLILAVALLLPSLAIGHDTVNQTDIVTHHGDVIPRFSAFDDAALIIPVGETFVVGNDPLIVDTIEVAGTLKFDRFSSVLIACQHLTVLPGGTLDMGTETDPFFGAAVVTILDQPIEVHDTAKWGNGIICLGNWTACGLPFPAWSAGEVPTDLAGIDAFRSSIQFEPTKNIIIQSQNPTGVRGHTVVTGGGYCDIQNVAMIDLGRTTNANLGPDNQVGRYAFHWHHCHPNNPLNHGVLKNCYVSSSGVAKWGVVIHGTHFTEVVDNVVKGFTGAGITTEDGNETNNTIHHNLVMDIVGNGTNDKFNQVAPNNKPGAQGSGIWLHGVKNSVTDNLCVRCAVGLMAFYRNIAPATLGRHAPVAPGIEPTEKTDYRLVNLIESEGNVSIDCNRGLEVWNSPAAFSVANCSMLDNVAGMLVGDGEPGYLTATDCHILKAKIGVSSSMAYTVGVSLINCHIEGCNRGMREAKFTLVDGCVFDNVQDIFLELRARRFDLIDTMLNGDIPIYFNSRSGPQLDNDWHYQEPSVRITNWQGSGDDYILVEPIQYAEAAAPVATPATYWLRAACPEAGLSMGQCYAKYGLARLGYSAPESELVPLQGVVGAMGHKAEFILGPSRFVLHTPNAAMQPIDPAATAISFVNTYRGEPLVSGDGTVVLVDGLPYGTHGILGGGPYSITKQRAPQGFTFGPHTVTTYITRGGSEVAGSRLDFSYSFGEVAPPPPPPPPPPPTTDERLAALELQIKQLQTLIAQLEALIAKLMGT
jgi:hypothetical protein